MPDETTTETTTQTGNEPGTNEGGATGTQTAATNSGKTFTQEDIDRIVQTRLNAQRAQFEKQSADKKLAEDGEWQKLAQTHEQRVKELESELTRKERDLLATRIAAKYGLPETLADRLVGDDAAALEADAKVLAKLVTPPASSGSPANGASNRAERQLTAEDAKTMTPRQIQEAMDKGLFNNAMGRTG